jgi:UPF0042 nucleotide-binding protein
MRAPRLVIITGLSGSGKSTAARALEDEGFFVVDNLPVVLLSRLLEVSREYRAGAGDLAIVLDVRNQSFLAGCDAALKEVRLAGYGVDILFFEASDASLLRRYSETRRRHPLAHEVGVLEGINRERELLERLRDQATAVTDTSRLTPHQLRSQVIEVVRGGVGAMPLAVLLQSFGFRHGIPPSSDLVMDVRFLPNPHFLPSLQGQSGLDQAVRNYVLTQPACQEFFQLFRDLLTFLLPHYRQEGKSYLTISIGCTGGRHRSVAVVEALGSAITGEGITLKIDHRDIDKG